ncbi:hypothetical protein GWD52_11640 [Enterobacteriaceae bacterium 4M9]|nr:hypothetical protein [Enterobacteriaceae bacterium 4M9]
MEEHTHQGSTLTAGNNLSVTATGAKGNGDITLQGSALQAGKDVRLDAARDLNLVSSADTRQTSGSNSSSGGSVGMSMTAGKGGGLSVSGSVNSSKGKESGNGVTHNETLVTAGNNVTLTSGRDTLLQGAQVSGESIKADVGRNLTLRSEQDSDRYDMKQTSMNAGGSATLGAGGSASISATRDRMHSNYDSVQEQTGLFAGKGGFDVTVDEHTQLDGAVIASTATADKNRLDTGTLGWKNIENKAEYDVEHQGGGFSTGGSIAGALESNLASTLLVGMNGSGDASSTTQAAVSDGSITIRDKDKQQQDVSTLSRDAEHANQTLSPIFDKEKEQQRIKEAQLIGEIGMQVSDIVHTEGQIAATKAANDRMASANADDYAKAKADWEKAHPDKTATADDISKQVYQNFYNEAFENTGLGTSGTVQRAIQAATAAVQGLAGGNIGQAISGAAAPYLAQVIKKSTGDNQEANVMAHAVLGAVTSWASGNSALAGAAGAATAELMAPLIIASLGWGKENLSETQKQTVSALATLAAGLSGGVAGDSTADTVAGAQAGKNAVENNSLSGDQARESAKQIAESLKNQVRDKLGEGTTSSIANAIINGLADSGDALLGGGDYALDFVMALASCATGDSYCSKALSDLSGKNQAAADTAKALMQSETWSAIADLGTKAYDGDQMALEATGGMIAGILLPGKKVPNAVKAVDPNIKIATGVTVGEFEASLFKYAPGERVAVVKQAAAKVVAEQGMVKDNRLTKLNNRDVYRGTDGNLYALDSQHGRFEKVTPQGKHITEVNFALKDIPDSKDKSGGHDLRVK